MTEPEAECVFPRLPVSGDLLCLCVGAGASVVERFNQLFASIPCSFSFVSPSMYYLFLRLSFFFLYIYRYLIIPPQHCCCCSSFTHRNTTNNKSRFTISDANVCFNSVSFSREPEESFKTHKHSFYETLHFKQIDPDKHKDQAQSHIVSL